MNSNLRLRPGNRIPLLFPALSFLLPLLLLLGSAGRVDLQSSTLRFHSDPPKPQVLVMIDRAGPNSIHADGAPGLTDSDSILMRLLGMALDRLESRPTSFIWAVRNQPGSANGRPVSVAWHHLQFATRHDTSLEAYQRLLAFILLNRVSTRAHGIRASPSPIDTSFSLDT